MFIAVITSSTFQDVFETEFLALTKIIKLFAAPSLDFAVYQLIIVYLSFTMICYLLIICQFKNYFTILRELTLRVLAGDLNR